MIIRGEIVDMTAVESIAAMEGDAIVGLIPFRIEDGVCEIISLTGQNGIPIDHELEFELCLDGQVFKSN